MPHFYTGLDLHKRSIAATTLDAHGHVIASAKLPARADALRLYFADCPTGPDGQHHAAVECTTGWYWVKDTLAEGYPRRGGGPPSRPRQGHQGHHHREEPAPAKAGVKTDAADARMLAQLLRTDLLPEAHMISDDLRPLRDVLRIRLSLVERRVGALNSVARLLEKMNVKDVADLPELMQLQARCHLDQVDLLQTQIKALEKALHPHPVPDADVQRLLRIPGVGKAVAFTIRLEVDDIDRFVSDRAFFSYCRLVPGADNSGGRVRHKRSKEGNRYLKLAFSHAGGRAIQYYPEVREWYRRKLHKKPQAVARGVSEFLCTGQEGFKAVRLAHEQLVQEQ